jgi:hypothetical protein
MHIVSVAATFPAHRHPQAVINPQAVITEALKEKVLSSDTAPIQRWRGLPTHHVCPLTYLE